MLDGNEALCKEEEVKWQSGGSNGLLNHCQPTYSGEGDCAHDVDQRQEIQQTEMHG